jgi:hypothetical protein
MSSLVAAARLRRLDRLDRLRHVTSSLGRTAAPSERQPSDRGRLLEVGA